MNYYGEFEQQGVFVASIRCISNKSKESNGESRYSSTEILDEENNQTVHALIR